MAERYENASHELSAIRSAGRAIAPLHEPIGPTELREVGSTSTTSRGNCLTSIAVATPSGRRTCGERCTFSRLANSTSCRPPQSKRPRSCSGHFYGAPVRMLERMDLAWVPPQARRLHPYTGVEQILTKFVLRLLSRKKPADAIAVLALTTSDLWPGKGWNFVFGQASLSRAVGVWSLHRLGDPELSPEPSSAERPRSPCTRPGTCWASGTAPTSGAA